MKLHNFKKREIENRAFVKGQKFKDFRQTLWNRALKGKRIP